MSRTDLKNYIQKEWIKYRVGKEKSVWKGAHAGEPDQVLVISWNGDSTWTTTYREKELKSAGTSTKKMVDLLEKLGVKTSNKLPLPSIG